jgi:PAS domain S-box-containing protein
MVARKILPSNILDHPMPTVLYDKNTRRILAANKAAVKAFGYSHSAWTRLNVGEFLKIDGKIKDNVLFTGTAHSKKAGTISVKGYFKTLTEKNKKYSLIIIHESPSNGPAKETHELEEKHTRVDKIVRVSHNEIYLINDKTLAFEYANNSALKNLGYTDKELLSVKLTDLFRFPDEMGLHALLNSLRRGETDRLQLQLKFTRKNGSHYDADTLIQELEKGRLFLLIVTDITSRLVTEKKLLDTIHEKETLIKEIHHRVKNNLQLISSIIYLKLASVTQDDIKNFLEDTRQKIRSIALIHERLLQTEKLDRVELSDYLGKLIHDLKVTYYKPDLSLEITTDIPEKMTGLDTAIICGLIVNELVTNAIKHAFTGRSSGVIRIGFREDDQGKFLLTIEDNGVSLPPHITPGYTSSFGMQLIDVFVKQLGGTFEIIREKGTTFRIHF